MKSYCVGVDIGGTSIKLGVFTGRGRMLGKWEIKTDKSDSGSHILDDIAASIKVKLSEMGISLEEIKGVGMGVPGPTMADGYVPVCVNLGWKAVNPAKLLSEKLGGVTVKCGNDANVATMGEMWKGGGKGYKNVVLFTLGTGVGGGVIINGKMVVGNRGLAGELGHMTVNCDETDSCNCGNKGCLEQYASATGVVKVAKRILEASDAESGLRNFETLTCKDVFDEAKKGDKLALEAVETLGKYLGMVLSYLTLGFDPDVFVIGGGVSKAGTILTDVVRKYYEKYTVISKEKAQIKLATLENDAGIYGAAKMAISR